MNIRPDYQPGEAPASSSPRTYPDGVESGGAAQAVQQSMVAQTPCIWIKADHLQRCTTEQALAEFEGVMNQLEVPDLQRPALREKARSCASRKRPFGITIDLSGLWKVVPRGMDS